MAKEPKSTQEFVGIKEIKNSILYLKKGGLRKVLIVNGVNFDLKSAKEQELILNSFQQFMNTLDFSVQFFIHSRKVNINSYLEKVQNRERQEQNELLKTQISEYGEFIRSFVEENPIITKNFFAVVPYRQTMSAKEAKRGVMSFLSRGGDKEKEGKEKSKKESMSEAIQQLNYRVDEVISGLEKTGLRVRVLGDEELTELFYNLYNPQLIEKKGEEIPTTRKK